MRLKTTVRGIATALLLIGALHDQALQASGWSFSNADVLSMLMEGRSDSAIMARIAEVQTAIFKLEPEDLTALRNAGASLGIISGMLARARRISGSNFGPNVMATFKGLKADTLPLVTRQGQQEIGFSRGEYSKEGAPSSHMTLHLDYPGLRASIRTTDPRPSLLIRFEADPATHYYLCKLSSIAKKNLRAFGVKVEMHAFSNVLTPEKGWRIASTATEEEKGVWRITPKADLEPGEYGLLDGVRLFEFGVDPEEKAGSPPTTEP